jgi:hypothetical protein
MSLPHTYTDRETGISITVYDGGYLDYGLMIENRRGKELYDNPHALNSLFYGVCQDDDNDEPWSASEWKEILEGEFDDLVDAFVGWDNVEE